MACKPCGARNAARSTFRASADGSDTATQAGSGSEYEVLNARGEPTNRLFSSLIAASGYAARIGGSTRPV